ncbi:MAG: cytochrome c [Bryobacterales bacterium]
MSKLALTLIASLALALPVFGELPESAPSEQVARGKHLAHSVAMCVQCHSPHDRMGNLLESKLFTGQAIPFTSPYPDGPKWAFRAPALVRLPGWNVNDFVELLMTGHRPDGRRPMQPMPPFRLSRQDAEAIAAYLKSL